MLTNYATAEQRLFEYEQLQSKIAAMAIDLTNMERRKEQVCVELEAYTAPRPSQDRLLPTTRGVLYKGEFIPCRSLIDIYRYIMRRLFQEFPHRGDAIATSVATAGMYRRYVSKEKSKLYDSRRLEKYAKQLVNGWYIDTNITTQKRVERILRLALNAVGLRWENDVLVQWYPVTKPQ